MGGNGPKQRNGPEANGNWRGFLPNKGRCLSPPWPMRDLWGTPALAERLLPVCSPAGAGAHPPFPAHHGMAPAWAMVFPDQRPRLRVNGRSIHESNSETPKNGNW